jgi:hypothetical protein
MIRLLTSAARRGPAIVLLVLLATIALGAEPSAADKSAPAIEKGQRVFVCGHSFHNFIANPLTDMARSAGYKDHQLVGNQFLGGSRTLQHWNLPDEKNKAKQALRGGKVDVLTLSPHRLLPDEGIDHFVKLGLEHNPKIRVTVQMSWIPYDGEKVKAGALPERDNKTVDYLKQLHAPYFKELETQVQALNKQHGKGVVLLVPAGQAVIALRAKIIAGQAPGLKKQSDLFSDALGHARPPLQALVTYCHYAVIYRRSPVGLPLPPLLAKAGNPDWDEKLNRVLQEVAWDTVSKHPLSGVQTEAAPR